MRLQELSAKRYSLEKQFLGNKGKPIRKKGNGEVSDFNKKAHADTLSCLSIKDWFHARGL